MIDIERAFVITLIWNSILMKARREREREIRRRWTRGDYERDEPKGGRQADRSEPDRPTDIVRI